LLLADIVRLAHGSDKALVVVAELAQHVVRINIGRVVVGDALVAADIANRV
jgi:hypothetical protein